MKVKRITDELRAELKKPFGDLFVNTDDAAERVKRARSDGKLIISVGDFCAGELLARGVRPDILVYDNICRRQPTPPELRRLIEDYDGEGLLQAENPSGSVTSELEQAIREAVGKGKGKILVEGEEDLAVLPAALEAPDGTLIIYGQPGEGVVLMTVDEKMRGRVRAACARMRE